MGFWASEARAAQGMRHGAAHQARHHTLTTAGPSWATRAALGNFWEMQVRAQKALYLLARPEHLTALGCHSYLSQRGNLSASPLICRVVEESPVEQLKQLTLNEGSQLNRGVHSKPGHCAQARLPPPDRAFGKASWGIHVDEVANNTLDRSSLSFSALIEAAHPQLGARNVEGGLQCATNIA